MALARSGAAGLRQWRSFAAGLQRAPRSRPPAARRRGVCVDAGVALRPVPGLTTLPWNATPEEEQVSGPHRVRAAAAGWPPGQEGAQRSAALSCVRRGPGAALAAGAAAPTRRAAGPQALAEVGRRMAACPHGAPDAATQQWFLRDRRLAVDAAVEKLTAYMQWRADFLPPGGLTRAHVAAEADSGKACLHAHADVNGRPVIIVRVSQHVTGAGPPGGRRRLRAALCAGTGVTLRRSGAQASSRSTAASATARTCWSRRSRSCRRTARPSWASSTCAASRRATPTLALSASW